MDGVQYHKALLPTTPLRALATLVPWRPLGPVHARALLLGYPSGRQLLAKARSWVPLLSFIAPDGVKEK